MPPRAATRSPSATRADLLRLRAEVKRLSRTLDEVAAMTRENSHAREIQFKRIAQLQAELDQLRKSIK